MMYQPISKALHTIGNKNKYQYLVILLLFTLNGFVNFILVGPTFIFMNPLFKCPGYQDLVDESVACGLSNCTINNDFTIVARLQLYCDKQGDRDLIQSFVAVGSIIGLIGLNYIADNKGRRIALLLIQFIAIIGLLLTIFGAEYKIISLLIIGQFLCGIGGYSMMLATYLYPYEVCEQEFRQKAIVSVNYSWCLTYSLIGVLYYWCNSWRIYLVYIVTIPFCIAFVITLFFLAQGPNFLYRHKRIAQCLESLEAIARINGKLQQFEQIKKTLKYEETYDKQTTATVFQNLKEVFKQKKYIRVVIILTIMQIGGNINYFGTNYALDQIGFQFGTNAIANGILQMIAFFTLSLVIQKISRKKSIISLYGSMAIIGSFFAISQVRQNIIAQATILALLRVLGTICYAIIIITLTEAFPMKIQSVCSGFIQSMAQLGILLGPIIINTCINLQIYPIIVLSVIVALFVVLPAFGLNETRQKQQNQSEKLLQIQEK